MIRGSQRATVVEVGGGLRTYSVDEWDILDGYGPDEMCTGGRGQVLMPWPNRIRDGQYTFGDQTQQLALSEVANRNAIHGLVRWASWSVRERAPDGVVMEHRLPPQPGYPFALELRIGYTLTEQGLRVDTSATNVGTVACPFGSGAHPYLSVGVIPIDGVHLQAPGATHLSSDERGIPVARASVEGSPLDLRRPGPIGAAKLDHCFSDLERDADGIAWAHLATSDGRRRVSLWLDQAYDYLMVFSGDTLGDRARQSVALEPMSCAPDAFRSGDGLITLEPGASFTGSWGITPGPLPD